MTKRLAIAAAVTLLTSAAPVGAQTWTIPGTVNASGLNGTRFVSDLAITNPGADPAVVVVSLVPATGTSQALLFLNPGQTIVTQNVLQSFWGVSGAAATQVTALTPLLIRARTYNTAASGTYGVALPVVADEAFLDASAPGESLWVSQSADSSSGYRTNIAVVFPNPDGGAATVTVFGADGRALGHQDYALDAAGFQQFAVGSFAGSVDVARAELVVTRGNAAGYSVVVDNVTGDSSLFQFEALPAGRQDILVNGVARSSGRNGTFFRTDARIFNPGSTDATITVAFHANQNSNPTPATATFGVAAGQIRDVVDVLQTLLGLPVGSAGALRFTSDAAVAILCRTSNVDPAGARPGTYGAQQRPTPLSSFLMSADSGAVVTGIRQNAAFRTNTGFAAGPDGAAWSLALKNAAGATVATGSGSLGPYGWTQPNVQDLFPATTIPDAATLQVKVTSGSLDVFDSSIDNASGDPVVTPIMPLPVVIPSSATIGPAGGSVLSDDGRFLFRIPAGALASATPVSVAATSDVAPNASGPAYAVTPGDLVLSKPALVSFNYGPGDVNGSAADLLIPVLHGAGGSWYGIPGWTVDTERRRLTASLPFPAPAAVTTGRATLAATTVVVEMARLLSLSGDELVPTGQTARYTVQGLKGPSPYTSTWDKVSDDVDLATVKYTWAVAGEPGGSTTFGTIAKDGGQTNVYQAPQCPPTSSGVVLSASFTEGGEPKKAVGSVIVFPENWILTITDSVKSVCRSNDKLTVSYEATAFLSQPFKVNRDRTLTPSAPLLANPTLDGVLSCALPDLHCTVTTTAPPTALAISAFGGSVSFAGYLHPSFSYRHMGTPSFTVVCDNGSAPIPGVVGKVEPRTDKGAIPWYGKDVPPFEVNYSGYTHTMTFKIHPNPDLCPHP